MRVLNIEDDIFKHNSIRKTLESIRISDIDHINNYKDALDAILSADPPYDLIITDMYYPRQAGGTEEMLGTVLIEELKSKKITTPIVVVSSARIVGLEVVAFHYTKDGWWDEELKAYVKTLKDAQ